MSDFTGTLTQGLQSAPAVHAPAILEQFILTQGLQVAPAVHAPSIVESVTEIISPQYGDNYDFLYKFSLDVAGGAVIVLPQVSCDAVLTVTDIGGGGATGCILYGTSDEISKVKDDSAQYVAIASPISLTVPKTFFPLLYTGLAVQLAAGKGPMSFILRVRRRDRRS